MKFLEFLGHGFKHIADWNAYDHILFIIVMCAIYQLKDWKKMLVLVTAFTVGHSLTLALSISKLVTIDRDLVEFLIPLTIIITAIWNMIPKKENSSDKRLLSANYIMVLFFGLIHGLGFSNYLGMMLGRREDPFVPFFGFNVGVELGQICIIIIFMLLSFLFLSIFRLKHKYWIWGISILAIIASLELLIRN